MSETVGAESVAGGAVPTIVGFHHFSPSVTDIEASVTWYERVFGMQRVPGVFRHYGSEEAGHGILLREPRSGIAIGIHYHGANKGERFDETRTGLDHMSFQVASRSELEAWRSRLDALGVPHSPITDIEEPNVHTVLVFRDPDNIQLEFILLP
jgi:glyoxylase I family protein